MYQHQLKLIFYKAKKELLTDISSCTDMAFFTASQVVMVTADVNVAIATGEAADGNWQPFWSGSSVVS